MTQHTRSNDKEFKELYINEFDSITQAEINQLIIDYVYLCRIVVKTGLRRDAFRHSKEIYHILAGHLGADLDNQIEMMCKTLDMIDPMEPTNFQYNGEYKLHSPKTIVKIRNIP